MSQLASEDRSALVPALDVRVDRLGILMDVQPDNPLEEEGVLNPATLKREDGSILLLPRLVGRGNRSCIGRARVLVGEGRPSGVEREGIVLRPDRGWEHGRSHAGVEDPRVTRIDAIDAWVMTYVAFGPVGPRPAVALSRDGESWQRLGPVQFAYEDALDTDLNLFPNKDVVFLPEPVRGPDGRASLAMLHRPMWDVSYVRWEEKPPLPRGVTDTRPSIWMSYVPVNDAVQDARALVHPGLHRFVAGPRFAWEESKVGAGPAPIRVDAGWILLHHGVTGEIEGDGFAPQKNVRYCAGAMLLDPEDPSRVLARTSVPILEPETSYERRGTVGNVVFPTAVEQIGAERFLFYGMADTRIGVARLVVTES